MIWEIFAILEYLWNMNDSWMIDQYAITSNYIHLIKGLSYNLGLLSENQ